MAFLRQCLQQLRLRDNEVDLLLSSNEPSQTRTYSDSSVPEKMEESDHTAGDPSDAADTLARRGLESSGLANFSLSMFRLPTSGPRA